MSADYPLASYNYKVSIIGEGDPVTLGCSKVTGLQVEQQPVVYRHGMSDFMGDHVLFPKRIKPFNVNILRGVVGGGVANAKYLAEWAMKTFSEKAYSPGRSVHIQLLNAEMEVLITWKINHAVPVSLSAPEFDAASNEVAIENIQLMAFDLEVEYA